MEIGQHLLYFFYTSVKWSSNKELSSLTGDWHNMQKHYTSSILMKLCYLHRAIRGNNLVFIVQDTRDEGSGAVQPRACFFSGAARKRQNTSSPEVAADMTTAAIRLMWLWFCAGNLTTWKKFTSNNISCLRSPFGPTVSNGITEGIDLFHRVYDEGTTNSNSYFRHCFRTFCVCWQLSQCSGSVPLCLVSPEGDTSRYWPSFSNEIGVVYIHSPMHVRKQASPLLSLAD